MPISQEYKNFLSQNGSASPTSETYLAYLRSLAPDLPKTNDLTGWAQANLTQTPQWAVDSGMSDQQYAEALSRTAAYHGYILPTGEVLQPTYGPGQGYLGPGTAQKLTAGDILRPSIDPAMNQFGDPTKVSGNVGVPGQRVGSYDVAKNQYSYQSGFAPTDQSLTAQTLGYNPTDINPEGFTSIIAPKANRGLFDNGVSGFFEAFGNSLLNPIRTASHGINTGNVGESILGLTEVGAQLAGVYSAAGGLSGSFTAADPNPLSFSTYFGTPAAPAAAGETLKEGLLDTGVQGLKTFGAPVTATASSTLTSGILDTGVSSLSSLGRSVGPGVGASLTTGGLDTGVAGLTAGGNPLEQIVPAATDSSNFPTLSIAKGGASLALKALAGGAVVGGVGAVALGSSPDTLASPTLAPTAPTLASAAASLAEGSYEQQRKQRLMTGKASTIFTSLGMAGINDQRTNKRFLGV